MDFAAGILVGVIIGISLGVLVASLLVASHRGEEL